MAASRTTCLPFSQWPWHARMLERLYRWTHRGQIRTLVTGQCCIHDGFPGWHHDCCIHQ